LSSLSAQIRASVEIWLRKRERVFDQLNTRFPFVCNDYFHDIESEENIWIVEHSQPGECAARDALALFAVDCFKGPSEILVATRFDFDEYERVSVSTNNIDLATAAAAEVPQQDFVTATLQVSARQLLAARAAPQMPRLG
jgi:hypothetical protein